MYSTARKMSLLTAILSAVNIIGVILYLMASVTLNLNWTQSFAIFMVMGSSAAINLLTTMALRSICQDLEYEYENTTGKLSKIDKKVEELESRL